ncbi:PPOX class F420-dependent oxidoreductase [Ilumatobacter sp.]|uniref:PPOX class F420-dependent oxidoreductase n=1 Tax=Ilumatobacter sp. TaxID=1967498 RepID=UPI003B52D921
MARQIATERDVERAEVEDFVRPRHHGLLLARKRDGSPQASLVTIGLDDDGRVVVSSYPERAKVRNLRRDPRVSIVVQSDDFGGEWVQLDGTAEVVDLPDALDGLCDYFRVISGEHPDWDEYREAMRAQGKCLIRITIDGWGPIASGGFPARLADD